MMTNSPTTTTVDDIAALIDEAAYALADVPGRTPQDSQIASCLLAYTMTCIADGPSQALLATLVTRGVDAGEALTIARALHSLSLRLGAWLGRDGR